MALLSPLVVHSFFLSVCICLAVGGMSRQTHWEVQCPEDPEDQQATRKKKVHIFYLQKRCSFFFFLLKMNLPFKLSLAMLACHRGKPTLTQRPSMHIIPALTICQQWNNTILTMRLTFKNLHGHSPRESMYIHYVQIGYIWNVNRLYPVQFKCK